MKYQNIKNGQIGTVLEKNEKFKTVTLEMEDGTSRSYSASTIKRWWKEIPEEEAPTEEISGEELAGDGTPYTEVMQEIITDGKKYVEEVMKQKKELCIGVPPIKEVTVVEKKGKKVHKKLIVDNRTNLKKGVLDILHKNSVSYLVYDRIPNLVVVKKDKKSVFELRVKKCGVTYNCRVADVPSGMKYKTVNNYYMPVVIDSDMDSWLGIFESLLNLIDIYGKEA